MNESLKDQLMALGFEPAKRKKPRKTPVGSVKGQQAAGDISLDQAYRIRDRQEQQQKQQAAAKKREQERQRRQTNQKLKAIVAANALRDESAEIKRNFLFKGRIRSVLVTAEQNQAIGTGSLGIVYLRGNYHLLPAEQLEKVKKFAPDHVPDLHGTEREDEKDHPVPDDLIW